MKLRIKDLIQVQDVNPERDLTPLSFFGKDGHRMQVKRAWFDERTGSQNGVCIEFE